MSVVGASGHARNFFFFFFCPRLKTSAKYFSFKGFILLFFIHHVLLTSLSYISLLLRKPYNNLTVGVQAGLVIFFLPPSGGM